MGKKKIKETLTIERQLERYYKKEPHIERNAILWHAWCQNRRWLSQLLETTLSSFPTYSRHDESHARTVLNNIEMILGEKRIRELSASDCFMLLHTVYIHDIGMVITHDDRRKIVENDKFIDMVEELAADNDLVFQKAVEALKKTSYKYTDADSREEKTKKLYADKLAVYYAILHLIANFRRSEHGDLSKDRLKEWTLQSEKLGSGFSMAGIPQRIFVLIAQCAGLHTDSDFENIMKLSQEDNGYVSDYVHPRFVAVLLQLGDILDMDNDRFHPFTRECIGVFPEISERHYEKHQAIRRLYIRPDSISIEADCSSQEALRLVRKECDILKELLKNASYNWMLICPRGFSGALPAIDSVKLYLNGAKIPEELVATQFCISQKKAFAILEGSNVYKDKFVFLREFLQNAIDASKMQYWHECVRTKGYYTSREDLKKKSPEEYEKMLSTTLFPIEIEMQIVMRDEQLREREVTSEEIERLKSNGTPEWEYGVRVRIKDFGTGIDKNSILDIAKVGNSRKREKYIIQEMPEWLKPTAEFGIGLQSAFILTNMFKCTTFTRSNEKYEIVFSTVKSNYYEGYINVRPVEFFDEKEDSFGTRFEIFVPSKQKLPHEMYPSAWNGCDYFDADYQVLRPIRHCAELLAQMALYIDSQIGEQLFPIHLNVGEIEGITIPLNLTKKNQLKKIRHNMKNMKNHQNEVREFMAMHSFDNLESDFVKQLETIFDVRPWKAEGRSWIYFYEKESVTDIMYVRTDSVTAIIDCTNGHMYLWNNELCTFCAVNIENFLLLEKNEMEGHDKACEHLVKNIRIYYKGIELEEIELPDIGNELIQEIDIKGKMERKYINLSRKGFTEEGRAYFVEQIYRPLLSSIHSTLQDFNHKYKYEMSKKFQNMLEAKQNLIREMDMFLEDSERIETNMSIKRHLDASREVIQKDSSVQVTYFREKLVDMFREEILSITMLAFFARKEVLDPILRNGCENRRKIKCYWYEVLRIAKYYSDGIRGILKGTSVLFDLICYQNVDLLNMNARIVQLGQKSKHFVDIFMDKNQFMIVSKRENKLAPWRHFLTSIRTEETDPVKILEKYFITDSTSSEKKMLNQKISTIGKNALEIAASYGIDEVGKQNGIKQPEYRQQYFLKWLIKYIPTVALFMNEDGNTRINIIHGRSFPSIYVNENYKRQVVKRIVEDTMYYGIQRFSIPSWQGLEYLKCTELPYALYFVKRGFFSGDSYGKVIFPFGSVELKEILKRMNSSKSQEQNMKISALFRILNAQRYITQMFLEKEEVVWDNIEIILSKKSLNTKDKKVQETQQVYSEFRKENARNRNFRISLNDEVREEYISLIRFKVEKITDEEYAKPFSINNSREFFDDLEKIYTCILLQIIGRQLGDNWYLPIDELFPEACNNLAKAWIYVINREYLKEASEIYKYSCDYLKELEEGRHLYSYEKQEKILKYIQEKNQMRFPIDYLRKCWYLYIEEMFQVFSMLEFENVNNPKEYLRDYELIEDIIQSKVKKGTEDGQNK